MSKYFAMGGRMTKWKGRVASVAPSLASVSVVALIASGAVASTTTLNDPVLLSINLGIADDLTITAPYGGINPSSGSSYAVVLDNTYVGTVENSGTVELRNPDTHTYGGYDETRALALWVDGALGDGTDIGVITNAEGGSITVDVPHLADDYDGRPIYVTAAGIYLDGGLLAGSQILNAGTISVWADGSEYEQVQAFGVSSTLGSQSGATTTNSGTIYVDAAGSGATVYAIGIMEGSTSTYTSDSNSYIDFSGTTTGDIVNSGDISATAMVYGIDLATNEAYGTGIYVTSLSDGGAIDNSGTLTVSATIDNSYASSGFAVAHGIWVEDYVDSASTISSTGVIDVTATGSEGGDAAAFGLEVGNALTFYDNGSDGSMDGTMTIGGDITSTASVTSPDSGASALAYGVMTLYAGAGSSMETTGTISANAWAGHNSLVLANGFVVGINDGTLTLGGDINAVSAGNGYVGANGVVLSYSGSSAAVDVTGTITASAIAQNDGIAVATGFVQGIDSGIYSDTFKVTQLTGVISVEASGASALAAGALSYYSIAALTTNTGTIEATATERNASGNDGALLIGPLLAGGNLNGGGLGPLEGFLSGILDDDFSINGAVGMGTLLGFASGIENTGDITVSLDLQTTSEGDALTGAAGMGVLVNLVGLVANSGTITASAINAPAAGMAVGQNSGLVLNSGTIHASASGEAGQAVGMAVSGTDGSYIVNTGTIIASNNADNDNQGIAVYATGDRSNSNVDGSHVILATGGFLEGQIILSGAIDGEDQSLVSLDVLGTAGSAVNWTVYGENDNTSDDLYMPDSRLGTAVFKAHVDDSMVWQFTTIDSSQFAAQRDSMADASSQSAAVQSAQTQAALATSQTGTYKAYGVATHAHMTYSGTSDLPITVDALGMWMGRADDRSYSLETYSNVASGTLDRDVTTSTLSAGGTLKTDTGLVVGFGIGGQSGEASMSSAYMKSSDSSYNGAYAGVTLAKQIKSFTVFGGLTAGMQSTSYDRWENNNLVVGGIDKATGDYHSSYVNAQAGAAGHFKLAYGITVSPGLTLRYTNARLDAYSETGDDTAALASVAEQSFGIMEKQVDLNVEKALGLGSVNAKLSLTKRTLRNGDSVDVTMIGDQETISGFAADTTTRTLSVGYSASLSTGLSLNVEASRDVGSDSVSGTTVGGGFKLAF
ncbi:MAG: autotransporter outer membrane beta-barrel domain-containing protein [Pseudomonadota bacterium]